MATAAVLLAVLLLALLVRPAPTSAAGSAITVYHGPTDRPRIALTFDDNFRPQLAVPALRTLMEYHVKATMFVTGMYTRGQPAINQAMLEGGFEIGDHSATHADLTSLSWAGLMYEIGDGAQAFRDMTGRRTVPLLRPPYGRSNSTVAQAAGEKGFRYVVQWDIDPSDWMGYSADTITNTVLRNAHNGAIVLLHMSATHTFEALPGIITGLRAKGYELVTVSELLKGNRRFLDVTEATTGAAAVERLVAAGQMGGYDDNYFGPFDPMTRAQFAKVAVLVAGLHTPGVEAAENPTFVDVPFQRDASGAPLEYPFDFVEEAVGAGLISGLPEQGGVRRFDPWGDITRLQLARMVARMARALKGYPETLKPGGAFRDVPADAQVDVQLVASLGLMTGYDGTRFGPWDKAQRSHVAVVMARFEDLPAYQPPPPTTTTTTAPTTTTTGATTTSTSPPTTTTTATTIPPPTTTTGTTAPLPPTTIPAP